MHASFNQQLMQIGLELEELKAAGKLTKEEFLKRLPAAVEAARSADGLQGILMYGEEWAREYFAKHRKPA